MAFGRPAPDAEAPLVTRVHLINLQLSKCNSIAEVVELISPTSDEELLGLRNAYTAARPGRSVRDLTFLHGVRRAIASEVSRRKLDQRKREQAMTA
jgi:hypothetical protein